MNSRGQMQEFMGIVLLILSLIVFVMMSRVGSMEDALSRSEQIGDRYGKQNLWSGANTLLFSTTNNKMFSDLLGYYLCTGDEVISFGENRNINISKTLVTVLNTYYGIDHWSFELDSASTALCYEGSVITPSCTITAADVRVFSFLVVLPCSPAMGEGTVYVY